MTYYKIYTSNSFKTLSDIVEGLKEGYEVLRYEIREQRGMKAYKLTIMYKDKQYEL
jgi:hypothetical protein